MSNHTLKEILEAVRDLLLEVGTHFEDTAADITRQMAEAGAMGDGLVVVMQGFDRQRQELEALSRLVGHCAMAVGDVTLQNDPQDMIEAATRTIHVGELRERFARQVYATARQPTLADEALEEQVF